MNYNKITEQSLQEMFPSEKSSPVKSVLGCFGLVLFLLVIEAAINALLALAISWLLTFTPWHLPFLTCFAILYIISIIASFFKKVEAK